MIDFKQGDALTIYAAGFFDGEGCICIDRSMTGHVRPGTGQRREQYRLRSTITNTEIGPLEEFRARWGGSIRTHASRERRRTVYQLAIACRQSERFLTDVLPWLRIKREQALLALEFSKTLRSHSNGRWGLDASVIEERAAMCQRMSDLKGRVGE